MMKLKNFQVVTSLILAGLLVGLAGVVVYHYANSAGVPAGIVRGANFTIYYPKTRSGAWQVDASTVKLDTAQQLLTYVLTSGSNQMSVSEQPVPDVFHDIPNYYEKLLESLNQYDVITTSVGTVTLTHPAELKGGQSAVLNTSNGTLLFAHPMHSLDSQGWTGFFNLLGAVK